MYNERNYDNDRILKLSVFQSRLYMPLRILKWICDLTDSRFPSSNANDRLPTTAHPIWLLFMFSCWFATGNPSKLYLLILGEWQWNPLPVCLPFLALSMWLAIVSFCHVVARWYLLLLFLEFVFCVLLLYITNGIMLVLQRWAFASIRS